MLSNVSANRKNTYQCSNLLHNSSSLVHHLLHSGDCFHHTLLRHSSAVEVIQDSGYQQLSSHDFTTIQFRGRCKREGNSFRQQCKVILITNMVIVSQVCLCAILPVYLAFCAIAIASSAVILLRVAFSMIFCTTSSEIMFSSICLARLMAYSRDGNEMFSMSSERALALFNCWVRLSTVVILGVILFKIALAFMSVCSLRV